MIKYKFTRQAAINRWQWLSFLSNVCHLFGVTSICLVFVGIWPGALLAVYISYRQTLVNTKVLAMVEILGEGTFEDD